MRSELRRDLAAAMKARDAVAVSALRSALAAIESAEAVDPATTPSPATAQSEIAGAVVGLGASEVERRILSDAELADIMRTEMEERLSAARDFAACEQRDRAERLRAEAEILSRYLPQPGS